ncbi:MAG: hypothetical protein P4L53_23760 [Candidatus Obscuribacterales bacterium]|nr:hypothetical protein [Candidatus Obscuribacterales bacterium]
MMNNDGLSTLDNGFLAGKFNGAIKRYKQTAAAIRFDGIRMNRTGKTGRKRAAVERQIVQELNLELRNWSVEMSLLEGDQKMLEAELAGAFDNDQDDRWMDDECPDCGRLSCRCDDLYAMDESHYFGDSRMDEGCLDCGCISCQCDFGHDDDYYGHDDFGRDYSMYGHEISLNTYRHERNTKPMTEEEIMKLEQEEMMWGEHEAWYGRNNLRTMTQSFGDEHYQSAYVDFDDYGFGYDDFGLYADEPVNEFGGLPNHFDPSFDYRTHFWAGDMYDWDFSVDFTDFTLQLDPMKARRASRFSEIAGRKVKRLDRYGRTHSNRWMNLRGDDKDIERIKDKTADKRAHKRLLDEVFGVEPKKGQKTRFRSMDEKEQYEKSLCAATKRDTAQSDNVDYSLPVRRMVTREVQVTRITTINGRRRVLSDGIEKMLCRR